MYSLLVSTAPVKGEGVKKETRIRLEKASGKVSGSCLEVEMWQLYPQVVDIETLDTAPLDTAGKQPDSFSCISVRVMTTEFWTKGLKE